ncbi:hypothetical protein D3C76_1869770 [compost metagenome]
MADLGGDQRRLGQGQPFGEVIGATGVFGEEPAQVGGGAVGHGGGLFVVEGTPVANRLGR